jgi:hypothetical protein
MSNLFRLSSPRSAMPAGYGSSVSMSSPEPDRHCEESMLDQLDRTERLRLVQFVCSFAWADFEIQPEEREFIAQLIRRLELGEDEDRQVQQWLDRPPSLDNLDPTSIPAAHRRFFVEAIEGLISADGEVAVEERDSFEIFKMLLAD